MRGIDKPKKVSPMKLTSFINVRTCRTRAQPLMDHLGTSLANPGLRGYYARCPPMLSGAVLQDYHKDSGRFPKIKLKVKELY